MRKEPLTYNDHNKVKFSLGHRWYYFDDWGFTIMAPPKCGSTAIKQFIYMHELGDSVKFLKQFEVQGKAYVVVRNPFHRFTSLWKSKCRDKAPLRNKRVHGMTPEELMDYIEDGAKDVHFTPQITLLGNINATLIPLESLNWWWHQSGFGSLGKFNVTEGEAEIGDELKQRVITFYADDLELYHKAQCDLCWDTVVSPIVDI